MSIKSGERQRFFAPTMTSQFQVCPIPFRVDSYNGCKFSCHYCFSQYFTEYSRRNNPDLSKRASTYLEMNDPVEFEKWLDRVMNLKEYNYNRGAEVAIRERLPVKFGGTADPFPPVEYSYRITYDMLKALHKYDYPVQILTKNPSVLSRYSPDFENPNWAVSVTIISLDEKFVKTAEPFAPPPKVRLKAIERLVSQGRNVMCKIQPAIYPKILADLPDLIKALKESGCWAFAMEGLKVRTAMGKSEQVTFEKIGKYSGDDEFMGLGIRTYYRLRGVTTGADMEMTHERKREYIDLALDLAEKYDIKGFVADNNMGRIGTGAECCGTERLRDYKIWGENPRVRAFGKFKHESEHLKKVVLNSFSYSGNPNRYRTLGDIMHDELNKKDQIF
jgi:DNA repair photolyase